MKSAVLCAYRKFCQEFISLNQLFIKQTIDSTVVPLGRESTIVIDILEYVYPKSHSNLFQCSLSFDSNSLIFGTIEPANATVFSWEKYIAQVKSVSV